jgi:hypothetical protein
MSIDQYLAISGINPGVWGKSGWKFLNSIALSYNSNKKDCYKKFFTSLPCILPCDDCGENLRKEMPSLDDALKDKQSLLKWLLKIRNKINKEQGKQPLTLKTTILEIFDNNDSFVSRYMWIIILVIILTLLICILKFYPNKKKESLKSEITSSLISE